METHIDSASFGSIVVNGKTYEHDIIISSGGRVTKRKKRLSRQVYGTSHVISRAEAEYIFETGTPRLIIGAGHNGMVILSNEANDFFRDHQCEVILLPTPGAVDVFNSMKGRFQGLFHVTC